MFIYKLGLSSDAIDQFGIDRSTTITCVLCDIDGKLLDSWGYENLAVAMEEVKNECNDGDQIEFF